MEQKKSVIEKEHNKFEFDFFKKIDAKFMETVVRTIKKNCYDNDMGWSILKSSTVCFVGVLFSFQLKSLMRNLH